MYTKTKTNRTTGVSFPNRKRGLWKGGVHQMSLKYGRTAALVRIKFIFRLVIFSNILHLQLILNS